MEAYINKIKARDNNFLSQQSPLIYLPTTRNESIPSTPSIPLKIWQTWHTKELPPSVEECVKNIKDSNPEFEHRILDATECRTMIEKNFNADILEVYDTLIPHAFKADVWRLCVLYLYGGIYLDVKFKCVNGFKFIHVANQESFCRDLINSGGGIYNAFIIAKPRNPLMMKFLYTIMKNIKNDYYGDTPLHPTGPLMMKALFTPSELDSFPFRLEFVYPDILFIVYNNMRILDFHKNYRTDQTNVAKHWSQYWYDRNIYNRKGVVVLPNYHNGNSVTFHTYPPGRCVISDVLLRNEIWEKDMHAIFEKYIRADSIVLEGGCHIGTHTLKMAYLCKHLYGFEPMPRTNFLLNENLRINSITNVTVRQQGLSNKIDKQKFQWMCKNNPGASGLTNNPMGTISDDRNILHNEIINVDLVTIDSLNLEKVDFIKLDIEGYESLAIEGGMETIRKCRPIITMEVWKNHGGDIDDQYTKDLFSNLVDIGYTVHRISGPDFLFMP